MFYIHKEFLLRNVPTSVHAHNILTGVKSMQAIAGMKWVIKHNELSPQSLPQELVS